MTETSTPPTHMPTLTADGNLQRYLSEIRKFPMLAPEEEFMLAKSYKEQGDVEAVHKLVTSHLRLVAKIAMGYRGYGLPVAELISEGNVGMMQAVKRFEPEKGFRLSTYAMWWIRASIQEYILHSWSLVKMGTTAAQKKLFFNLRRLKGQIKELDDGDLPPESVKKIATTLAVNESDVVQMNRRMSGGDQSLNAPMRQDGDAEWQDWLIDDTETQDVTVAENDELSHRREMLDAAMANLTERERRILTERRLKEDPMTLEDLSKDFGVSRERVRQIEVRAFDKVQRAIRNMAMQDNLAQEKAVERFKED